MALGGQGVVLSSAFVLGLVGTTEPSGYPEWFLAYLFGLVSNLGVLGLGMGLASVLSGFRHRPMAVLGIVASSLALLVVVAMMVT
jgi:hypothetical protein